MNVNTAAGFLMSARLAILGVGLMICGSHAARADRAIHCKEGPNISGSTLEIEVRQQPGGYMIGDAPAGLVFETEDRRKAVLYRVTRQYVQVVTVDFQAVTVDVYEPLHLRLDIPGLQPSLPDTHSYRSGCQRLD